mmetsp:Transcript_24267/g.56573  ORF Transcript_24267/g.56573 Transcript_24267/m.56573 type:complete len:93 (+) Transcript_24267:221-499(+)
MPESNEMEEDDDEDGPVVVSSQELERFQQAPPSSPNDVSYPEHVRAQYPILFASQLPHEDIVMTCARALDLKVDVSVVREAAAYLENVEAKR